MNISEVLESNLQGNTTSIIQGIPLWKTTSSTSVLAPSWTTIASRQCLHAQIHKLASVFSRTIDQYCHVQQETNFANFCSFYKRIRYPTTPSKSLLGEATVCKCSAGAQIKLTNLFCASSPHRRICLSYWAASSSLINGSSISIVGICNLDWNYVLNQPLIHTNRMSLQVTRRSRSSRRLMTFLRTTLLRFLFSFYILINYALWIYIFFWLYHTINSGLCC